MTRKALSHTADTGIEATAPTFTGLLEELAAGMFELMAVTNCTSPRGEVSTSIDARTREDLVVDMLSELLYLSETGDQHLCRFEFTCTGELSIAIRAHGVPLADAATNGPPIKAVTYHRLEVIERDGGWFARVYFDV